MAAFASAAAALGEAGFPLLELPDAALVVVLSHLDVRERAPARAAGSAELRGAALQADQKHPCCAALLLRAEPQRASSGEVTLYHLGRRDRPMTMWLELAEGQPPREFVTLRTPLDAADEPAVSSLREQNLWGIASAHEELERPNLVTKYRKIRVDPLSLLCDTSDTTHATTKGEPMEFTWHNGQTAETYSYAPLATAYGSVIFQNTGEASLDLACTSFVVDAAFAAHGHGGNGTVAMSLADDVTDYVLHESHVWSLNTGHTPAATWDMLPQAVCGLLVREERLPKPRTVRLTGGGFDGGVSPLLNPDRVRTDNLGRLYTGNDDDEEGPLCIAQEEGYDGQFRHDCEAMQAGWILQLNRLSDRKLHTETEPEFGAADVHPRCRTRASQVNWDRL